MRVLTRRVRYTMWFRRGFSARRTGSLTILVAAPGLEMLQRYDKAAPSTGALPHWYPPHSALAWRDLSNPSPRRSRSIEGVDGGC